MLNSLAIFLPIILSVILLVLLFFAFKKSKNKLGKDKLFAFIPAFVVFVVGIISSGWLGGITAIYIYSLLIGAFFALQYFLAKRGKILGLIIPIISFSFSLIVLFSSLAYTKTTIGSEMLDENGEIISQQVEEVGNSLDTGSQIFVAVFMNIPTALFLAEYFIVRTLNKKKNNKTDELNKINIQDL